MTDSGTKCAWVIHESKAVQLHVHDNRRCLYVPRVPGSVKIPHNNNNSIATDRSKAVLCCSFYLYSNSEEIGGAYCFWGVRPSVRHSF